MKPEILLKWSLLAIFLWLGILWYFSRERQSAPTAESVPQSIMEPGSPADTIQRAREATDAVNQRQRESQTGAGPEVERKFFVRPQK